MKLLLTSTGLSNHIISNALLELAQKSFSKLKVAFIPNAADNYEDKWFVIKDRDKLIELGMQVNDVDLRIKNNQELAAELNGCDIIFVAGGNTFYLLQKVRESGADKIISELVKSDVIYIGSSAGSILAGPTLEPIQSIDEPEEAPELKSLEGLGLVDFVTIPHFDEKSRYFEKCDAIIKKYQDKYKLVPISDAQAILVNNVDFKIVGN